MKKKIFVALDTSDIDDALNITKDLKDYISGIKLGLQFFSKNGPGGIKAFSEFKIPIFLDLKFFDITNTVTNAIKSLDGLPISYTSIHLSSGMETLLAAKKVADSLSKPIKLLGISVLTSFSEKNLSEVGVKNSVEQQVDILAQLAKDARLHGIVCSSHEIKKIRNICKEMEIFVPGIRLEQNKDDQKRVVTPREAIDSGADYLVIGRPITTGNPLENIKKIINSLS